MVNVYQVYFQVADALDQPFPHEQFDLVWSMDSGQYIPNKKKVDSSHSYAHTFYFYHITCIEF